MQVLRLVETQRNALNSCDIRMEVELNKDFSLLCEIEIRSTMRDLKLAQEEAGLGLTNFPCSLCHASKQDIRNPDLIRQGFVINRTLEEMHKAGHYARLNPDGLNREQLGLVLKGSKGIPVTMGDKPILNNAFDSLHFKLGIARFLKNILVRVNSGFFFWNIDQKLRNAFEAHQNILNSQLTKVLGIQKRQQLQGNEADKLLSIDNVDALASMVTNVHHQENMRFIIQELAYLNLVIQSYQPRKDHSLVEFGTRAKNLQLFLLDKYSWVSWPDYLHIGLAHSVELLQSIDSIAQFSAQGKESKNRYVRVFKEHFSRKCSNALSIRDVLIRDWTLSSPILRGHGKPRNVRRQKCNT